QLARAARSERRPTAAAAARVPPPLGAAELAELIAEPAGSGPEIRSDLADRFIGLAPVVDIGSGRGEMLKLLAERNIEATGVDIDPELVAQCRTEGLHTIVADGLDYLLSLEDSSLGGIFAGRLLEH